MDEAIERVMRSLGPDWDGADLSDLNACSSNGDNLLHVALFRKEFAAAKALIDAGIDALPSVAQDCTGATKSASC
jgi:ankyrin repeat protein